MLLYIENPKDSTQKLINDKFSKVGRYKTNMQKYVPFLCTKNEISEREYKNNNSISLQDFLELTPPKKMSFLS